MEEKENRRKDQRKEDTEIKKHKMSTDERDRDMRDNNADPREHCRLSASGE